MAKGRKTGGRQAGTPNKVTAAARAAAEASGVMPLDYLLSIMRDESRDLAVRLEAAKAAAPYVHPRLAAVTHKGDAQQPVRLILNGSDLDG
jgi:hypothetical protein